MPHDTVPVHRFLSTSALTSIMDVMSLVTALLGAQAGNTQLNLGADLMRMNANSDRSVAQLLGAAAQNASSLANVAAGIGTNLNIAA